jgi:hypothetical protein
MQKLQEIVIFWQIVCASKKIAGTLLSIGYVQVGGIRGLTDTSARSGAGRNYWFACKVDVYTYMTV